jgi:CheY-like chemotaxis protein
LTDIDHEGLRAWYRNAMQGRVAELEAIRFALASGKPGARRSARALGQQLRGSGGSFGFPQVTEMGTLLEDGPDAFLSRHVEGALAVLRAVAWPDDPSRQERHSWLSAAADVKLNKEVPAGLDAAWTAVAEAAGLDEDALARRVGAYFSLEVADLEHADALAVRLVPPATCVAWAVVPLAEDDIHIRVATADPTDLGVEAALMQLTGRIPLFEVAPPRRIREALAGVEAAPAPPPPSTPTQPLVGPITVLVVDDDRGARLMAATVLTRKGYAVVEAEDGVEALDVVGARSDVRLVVTDLDMPVMGGLELVRRLKAAESTVHLPVVMLTGAEDPLTEASLIEEGADDYVRKPLDPRLFLARVRATLRRAGVRGAPATPASSPGTTVESG